VTVDWVLPDPAFHGHVRMYGADFPEQLKSVGFDASDETWLLKQPREELMAVRAFPLRMQNAWKR
jgi:hypothetical protein